MQKSWGYKEFGIFKELKIGMTEKSDGEKNYLGR